MPGYDFIGDVHGQYGGLVRLLAELGYRESDGVYRHAERIALFIGDLVDRGPEVRRTLRLVRRMCEAGSALCLLGNHEYNLAAWLTRGPHGGWLREHNEKYRNQLIATLDSFKGRETELADYREWMLGLPLYLDLREIRAVHACWDHLAVAAFWCSGGRFTPASFRTAVLERDSPVGRAAALLLKGRKIPLPAGLCFTDSQGFCRTEKRVRWWEDPRGKSYEELFVLSMYNLQGDPALMRQPALFPDGYPPFYGPDEEPVVFGHYWLQGQPAVIRDNILCTDYGAGAGQLLAAYRWSGEEKFTDKNWIWVPVTD